MKVTDVAPPPSMADLAEAFHRVAVAERDLAWHQLAVSEQRCAQLAAVCAAQREENIALRAKCARFDVSATSAMPILERAEAEIERAGIVDCRPA